MVDDFKNCLWKNFAACIDMLKNAIAAWPEEHWNSNKKFFYIAYHTTVFLDYYLSIPLNKFSPQLAYTITDFSALPQDAIDDVVPDKIYSKKELLNYVQFCRKKCKSIIGSLSEKTLSQQWIDKTGDPDLDLASAASINYNVMEILFYGMRHVQHHVAQLNLMLRQIINYSPDYISEAEDDLYN